MPTGSSRGHKHPAIMVPWGPHHDFDKTQKTDHWHLCADTESSCDCGDESVMFIGASDWQHGEKRLFAHQSAIRAQSDALQRWRGSWHFLRCYWNIQSNLLVNTKSQPALINWRAPRGKSKSITSAFPMWTLLSLKCKHVRQPTNSATAIKANPTVASSIFQMLLIINRFYMRSHLLSSIIEAVNWTAWQCLRDWSSKLEDRNSVKQIPSVMVVEIISTLFCRVPFPPRAR